MTEIGVCPRCRLPLSAARAGVREVHGCVHCGGVWLDPELAQQVAHAIEPELRTMAEIAAGVARAPVDAAAPAHCPACHAPLHRFHVTPARIELDACGRHGTWFDRGELVKVARELAVERAYAPSVGGPKAGHLAAAAAIGVAGVGGVVAAQQLAQQRPPDDRAQILSEVADAALEVGGDTVIYGMEVSVDAVASVADGADLLGGAAEVAGAVVEVGGTVLGGALEVLGSIFDGFG